jgi:hypothetical protein
MKPVFLTLFVLGMSQAPAPQFDSEGIELPYIDWDFGGEGHFEVGIWPKALIEEIEKEFYGEEH